LKKTSAAAPIEPTGPLVTWGAEHHPASDARADAVAGSGASERRAFERTRCLLAAKIFFNAGATSIDCMIRNISPTGAQISVDAHVVLPGRFDLYITQRAQTFQAVVKWIDGPNYGLDFEGMRRQTSEGRLDPSVLLDRLLTRINELEAENLRLRGGPHAPPTGIHGFLDPAG
jgi:hypothetical protein